MATEIQLKTGDVLKTDLIREYFLGRKAADERGEQYPVDLDDIWPFAYCRKDNALRAMRRYLLEGKDYSILINSRDTDGRRGPGQPRTVYKLTLRAMDILIGMKNREIHAIYLDVFQAAMDHVRSRVDAQERRDNHNLKLTVENAALSKEIAELQRAVIAFKDEKIRALEAELQTARSSAAAPSLPAPAESEHDPNEHWTLTNFAARFRRQLPMKADVYSKKLGLRATAIGVRRGESYSYIPHPTKLGETLKVTTFTYPYWFLDAEIPKNRWST